MNTFNLPAGATMRDIDPPQYCTSCGEQIQGDPIVPLEDIYQAWCEGCAKEQMQMRFYERDV